MNDTNRPGKTAVLYRMVTDEHICPFGLKSKDLLEREGLQVDDRHLINREETDAFKAEHGVKTTPQTFIGGERVGGYDDLRAYFDKSVPDEDETTYVPIIAIFGTTLPMALATTWLTVGTLASVLVLEHFIALSMCVLAVQKLRDLEGFSNGFLGYDLLAQRVVRYAYVYPFAEASAGILMLAGVLTWISAPLAIFIGGVGAVSVIKAVYIDNRDIKCACVGGDSNVPLGFVSLTENVMMVAMGLWMGIRALTS